MFIAEANSETWLRVQEIMQNEAQLEPERIKRFEEQSKLLLRTYQTEFSKDPTSRATESSRSNLIALRHTIKLIYGDASAVAVANPFDFAADAVSSGGWPTLPLARADRLLNSRIPELFFSCHAPLVRFMQLNLCCVA